MKINKNCFLTLIIMLLSLVVATSVAAQSPLTWSPTINLAKNVSEAWTPLAVGGPDGRVHVFWRGWAGPGKPDGNPRAANAIFYTQWNGTSWSQPNDVFAGPDIAGNGPSLQAIAVDSQGYLNVIWGDASCLNHSRVHPDWASNPRAWHTRPVECGNVGQAALVADSGGGLHLVYANNLRDLYYRYSSNYGRAWTLRQRVWSVRSEEDEALSLTRMAVDEYGHLHVVWTTSERSWNWNSPAVWYARSTDQGKTWHVREVARSAPGEKTTSYINVALRTPDEVHLVWLRGAGALNGRYHSWSTDNGLTWSMPKVIRQGLSGLTAWPSMAVDSAGTLHLLFSADRRGGKTTVVHYMKWNGQNWSEPYLFQERGEWPNLVVTQGNLLHAIWNINAIGGIAYSQSLTDAPYIAPKTFPPPEVAVTPTPTLPPTPATAQATTTMTVVTTTKRLSRVPMTERNNAGLPILLGVLPALVLMGAAIVIHQRSRR